MWRLMVMVTVHLPREASPSCVSHTCLICCRFVGFCASCVQISPSELSEIMRGLGDKLSDEEIELLVKAADLDGDGTISVKE